MTGLSTNTGEEFNELIGMISCTNMERMFSVNVYGTINMLQTVSRVMGRQPNGGSIVNIVSLTALRGNRGQLVYSATKGAVVSVTKSATKELAAKKIRVNAIVPGLTNTDMMKQAGPEKSRVVSIISAWGGWQNRRILPKLVCLWFRTSQHIFQGRCLQWMVVRLCRL